MCTRAQNDAISELIALFLTNQIAGNTIDFKMNVINLVIQAITHACIKSYVHEMVSRVRIKRNKMYTVLRSCTADLMFVKCFEISILGKKLPKHLAHYFKLDFKLLIHVCTSHCVAQAKMTLLQTGLPFFRLNFVFVVFAN